MHMLVPGGAVATMLFALLSTGASVLDMQAIAGICKMTASTSFLVTAVAAGALHSIYGKVLFAGLFCSWWGDLFLIGSGDLFFLGGLISFFIAHVAYCIAYAAHGANPRRTILALAALALPALLMGRWLWPGVPDNLRGPVAAYIGVITLMVALAVGVMGRPGGILILLGAIAFYLSDIFVARRNFVQSGAMNVVLGLPLYFGAQAMLAGSIAWVNAGGNLTDRRNEVNALQ